jgi:hypothetical protein
MLIVSDVSYANRVEIGLFSAYQHTKRHHMITFDNSIYILETVYNNRNAHTYID